MGRLFKFIFDFFFLLYLLFVFFSPFFLLLGALLIWKASGIVRILGCLLILLVTYYRFNWISPWYVVRGRKLVQKFNLNEFNGIQFSSSLSPWWMDAANCLLFVPDERVYFPKFKNILLIDLEAQQTYCQPMSEVNLVQAKRLKSLNIGYGESRDKLSLYYASASKKGALLESSFISFSLPILGYRIPFPGGSHGWEWGKTYFGLKRLVVKESESSSVVVELNKIVFNDNKQYYYEGATAWVMAGKFLILEASTSPDRCVLVLGPFNTSTE